MLRLIPPVQSKWVELKRIRTGGPPSKIGPLLFHLWVQKHFNKMLCLCVVSSHMVYWPFLLKFFWTHEWKKSGPIFEGGTPCSFQLYPSGKPHIKKSPLFLQYNYDDNYILFFVPNFLSRDLLVSNNSSQKVFGLGPLRLFLKRVWIDHYDRKLEPKKAIWKKKMSKNPKIKGVSNCKTGSK